MDEKTKHFLLNLFSQLIVCLLVVGLISGGITLYFLDDISKLKTDHNKKISSLTNQLSQESTKHSANLASLRTQFEAKDKELKELAEQKDSLLEQAITSLENQYKKQLQEVIDLIEVSEEKKAEELKELKEKLSSIKVGEGDFSELTSQVIQSVVSITAGSSLGSGAVVDKRGFIVTNYHVVQGASKISVKTYSGRQFSAELVGHDSAHDIALLKVEMTFNDYLKFASAGNIRAGEKVLALGSPLGLDFTVTEGIISATDREVTGMEGDFIQTSVSINPGNSGGPLVNSSGQIVGLSTFKLKATECLGFAVPSKTVEPIVGELIVKWEQWKAQQEGQGAT